MTMKDFESLQKQQEAIIAAQNNNSSQASPENNKQRDAKISQKDSGTAPIISSDLIQVPIHRGPLAGSDGVVGSSVIDPVKGAGTLGGVEHRNTQSKYQKVSTCDADEGGT